MPPHDSESTGKSCDRGSELRQLGCPFDVASVEPADRAWMELNALMRIGNRARKEGGKEDSSGGKGRFLPSIGFLPFLFDAVFREVIIIAFTCCFIGSTTIIRTSIAAVEKQFLILFGR